MRNEDACKSMLNLKKLYDDSDSMKAVSKFPVQQGTVIQLSKDMFLIWSHGSVQNDELAGTKRNYYKNGRGIPAPLLIKRFMGKADGATLAHEIMMLTRDAMLKKIRLSQFKSFELLDNLEIKPLTILCGVNSGGKSSTIKSLLLLKQSYENY